MNWGPLSCMIPGSRRAPFGFLAVAVALSSVGLSTPAFGQERPTALPREVSIPVLMAGAREPVTSAAVLGVTRNPNEHGAGVEVEVSLGYSLPVFLFRNPDGKPRVLIGVEAGVFARFGLRHSDGESRLCRVKLSVFSTTEIGEPLQILFSAIGVEGGPC